MSDLFSILNEATAVVAFALSLLVLRGFIPYLLSTRDGRHSSDLVRYLSLGVSLMFLFALARLTYYDLWRTAGAYFRWIDAQQLNSTSQAANALFNFGVGWAAYFALLFLLHAIPASDRGGYNILTAPFYPRKCWLLRRIRE